MTHPRGQLQAPGITATPAFVCVLMAVVALVYLPGLHGGFVFDDFPNIVDNTRLHVIGLAWREWVGAAFSSPASDLQRPLAMVTFAANYYFTGLDPAAMKATNIAIHAINTCLAFGMVRRVLGLAGQAGTRAEWAARFVACVWALHPINLMAVLFVVQRMESLSHLFVFAGLWMYLHGRGLQLTGRNGWTWIVAGLLGGTCLGTLAKESAVLLPLYAGLAEAILPGLRFNGPRRQLHLLFALVLALPAAIGGAYLWIKVATVPWPTRGFNLAQRLMTELRVVVDYLGWSLAPSLRELSLYHDDYLLSRGWLEPPSTLLSGAALVILSATAFAVRRSRPLSALGIAWFLGAQLLTATFIPLELVYEHRNYFASFGICLVLGDLLVVLPATGAARRVSAAVACLVVAAYGATTALRASEWSDPYRFASSEAAKHPTSPRATYSLGRLLVIMSEYDPESTYLRPAIETLERSRQLPRSGVLPHSALLILAGRTHIPQDPVWWQEFADRLRTQPIGPQETAAVGSLVKCAVASECDFRREDMHTLFDAVRSRQIAEFMNIEGDYRLNVENDPDAAIRLWSRAIQQQPSILQYRINLARLYIALGRVSEAREAIMQLRKLGRWGNYEAEARGLETRLPPRTYEQ